MQLGNLQMKLGMCNEAVISAKQSLADFPTERKEKLQSLLISGEECVKKVNQAQKYTVKRNYGEAIKLLESVLETATSATSLRIDLARLLKETQEWEKLLQVCGTILRTRPDDIEILYMRGWGYLMTGDKDTAQIHFKKVLCE